MKSQMLHGNSSYILVIQGKFLAFVKSILGLQKIQVLFNLYFG